MALNFTLLSVSILLLTAAYAVVSTVRRAARPLAMIKVIEEGPASSSIPPAAVRGTTTLTILSALRMTMASAWWESSLSHDVGPTSVGLVSKKTFEIDGEEERFFFLWLVSPDGLTVRAYRTVGPRHSAEGDWSLSRSPRLQAMTEEIGVYQASISSEGEVELPQQLLDDMEDVVKEAYGRWPFVTA